MCVLYRFSHPVGPETTDVSQNTTDFLHESNVKSLCVACPSACLQDSAPFRNSLPGFTSEEATHRLCHRSGANQLRNFIAHSNPKKQAWTKKKTTKSLLVTRFKDLPSAVFNFLQHHYEQGSRDELPR